MLVQNLGPSLPIVLSWLLSCDRITASPLEGRSASPKKVYEGLKSTALIPYSEIAGTTKQFLFNNPPHVTVAFNGGGKRYNATIDTGSSAFLVGAGVYPGFNAKTFAAKDYTAGQEYLSSSKRLYTGYWVPTTVDFVHGNATAKVDVLVVTKLVKCPLYDEATGVCPESSNSTQECSLKSCAQTYMGIGFGRSKDGQTDITPANNALLNVVKIKEKAVPANYHPGYIITAKGIYAGISAGNSQNFTLVKLQPTSRNLTHDWDEVSGCITVAKPGQTLPPTNCVISDILLDTGVNQSYLTFTPANDWTNWITPSGYPLQPKYAHLPPGTKVSVRFGEIANGAVQTKVTYSFTVNGTSPSTPAYANAQLNSTVGATGFVNTGRNFYKTQDILFDAADGYWGLRKR